MFHLRRTEYRRLDPGERLPKPSPVSGSQLGKGDGRSQHVAIPWYARKHDLRVKGQQDLKTKVMITRLASFAEVERDLNSERSREGRAKARPAGRKLGRPTGSLDGKEDDIRRFCKRGFSKSAIPEFTWGARQTLHHFIGKKGISSGA